MADWLLTAIIAIVVILIAWALLKFVLKMTARVVGCTVTALIAIAIVVVAFLIFI